MKRSEKAKATLDHQYIKSAFQELTENCHKVIQESAHDQAELREDMYYMLRALKALQRVFFSHLREGKAEDLKKFNIKHIKR